MNERIKELKEQAMEWVPNMADPDTKIRLLNAAKFAELIVRECVQSIEKTIETNCDTDSEKMGCEFAITDLLEHFGVKE